MPLSRIGIIRHVRPSPRSNNSGFTLIELLVVLIILGIVAGFALLATGDFVKSRHNEAELDEFKQLTMYTEEQAIVQSTTYGIKVFASGYQFYRLMRGNGTLAWQIITNDNVLTQHAWPADAKISGIDLQSKGPNIIINQDGTLSPFNIAININPYHYQIMGYSSGIIEIIKTS